MQALGEPEANEWPPIEYIVTGRDCRALCAGEAFSRREAGEIMIIEGGDQAGTATIQYRPYTADDAVCTQGEAGGSEAYLLVTLVDQAVEAVAGR